MIYRKNMYLWEQILRIAGGVTIVTYGLAAVDGSWLGYGLIAAGLVLAATGVVGWCPMCAIAGRRLKNGQQARS